MPTVDIHQHVWTQPLLDALAARQRPPYIRRDDGLCVLHARGEMPWVVDEAAESATARAELLDRDRVDRAVIALSSPIGIESLPSDEAHALIAAHLDGVLALGERFAAWGPIATRAAEPDDVDDVLARGCVGISLPATALADRAALAAIGPVLARAQDRDALVFVHPGAAARQAGFDDPLWWTALTDYVAQMQAAWLTFVTAGRRELPRLRIVFGMLAGGAPLQAERLAARGGPPVTLQDPLTWYDTSSYGPRAVEALARWLGPDRLVYGSDRPLADPVPTGREAALMANGAALLAGVPQSRGMSLS